MSKSESIQGDDLREAYRSYEQQATLKNIQIGCVLGILLMPAGWILDRAVYGDYPDDPALVGKFLVIRFASSALIALFWAVVVSPLGRRFYRELGVLLAMIPAGAITLMIALADGAVSPYYAGLNLVLLVVGFVVRWTFRESVTAVLLVIAMYVAACLRHQVWREDMSMFVNNMYFLVLTGIIVVTGDYFRSRQRESEFALRYEVEKNRQMLEEQNDRLRELDESKSRFFANISHELRTPLTLLLAPVEAMRNDPSLHLDERVTEWLSTMHANGLRLLKLINDLLDLVRSDSGTLALHREAFGVTEFVRGLVSAVQKVAEDRRLTLRAEVDSSITPFFGDRDKLEKVFLNLLFNAIKFTPAGGTIVFAARETGEDALEFSVTDNGMGISPDQREMIFTRFWQADMSARRKYQGVGIGLALARELVELHGGIIEVAGEEGAGATFTVRLPRAKQEVAADTEWVAPSEPVVAREDFAVEHEWLAKLYRRAELFPSIPALADALQDDDSFPVLGDRLPKLLVADDEPDMLRFLRSTLSGEFRVLDASDGQQAIEKARQYAPDVIICDMMMPEVDGLEVCRRLRALDTTRHVPVLLLTARADEETKIEALTAGASDFLSKPFSTTELRVRVKNLCHSHLLQRQLAWQNRKLESTLEQLKETETHLVQTEKMASLGRMSAGIIHEINNPLNYARGAIQVLRKKRRLLPQAEQGDFDEILHDIEEGVTRVARITADLRTFSHPGDSNVGEVAVRDVFETALRFTSHEWRGKIQVENAIPPDVHIEGNEHRLVQLAINLIENAIDALRRKSFEGGESPRLRLACHSTRDGLIVRVWDNGLGMSRDIVDKIFEPFYTTKPVGEGVGLGLSVVHRIVREHGGSIQVRSEPGEHCEFALEFPMKMTDSAA